MLDYDTIVTALFMDGDEYNRCTGCGKMTQEDKLSSGRCDICSAPVKGMPMAASLNMDAIAEKVAEEMSREAAVSWDNLWLQLKKRLDNGNRNGCKAVCH